MDGIAELARMLGKEGASETNVATATVVRVEDGTVWARVEGGAGEFPCHRSTVDCAPGDTVTVEIEDGRATVTGSTSAPSISAARAGELMVPIAAAASEAQAMAGAAGAAAQSAQESAAKAEVIVDTLDEMAEESGKTVEQILQDAGTAGIAAAQAQESADRAVYALSDVEKVVGTVEWIAEHGEYVNQAGQTFDPTKTYYTRSGTAPNYVYTIVAEPVAANMASYYVLELDESVQNFLASHIWMDSYGLNLSVDSANGYRIHQGTVDGQHTAGMYILDGSGDIVAKFGADGAQIGMHDSHNLKLTSNSMGIYYGWDRLATFSSNASVTDVHFGGSDKAIGVKYSNAEVVDVHAFLQTCHVSGGKIYDGDDNLVPYALSGFYGVYNVLDEDGDQFESGTYGGIYYYEPDTDFNLSVKLSPEAEIPAVVNMDVSAFHAEIDENAIAITDDAQNAVLSVAKNGTVDTYGDTQRKDSIMNVSYNATISGTRSCSYRVTDKNNQTVAQFVGRQLATGEKQAIIDAFGRNSNGDTIWNSFYVAVDKAGNRYYGLTEPAAFRKAINVAPIAYGMLSGVSTMALTTSAQKALMDAFTGVGCSKSSNGIKVNEAGVYLISAQMYYSTGFTSGDLLHTMISKNGNTALSETVARATATNPYTVYQTGPVIASLAAGDTVYVYVYNQTGARGYIVSYGDGRGNSLTVVRIA